MVPRLEMTRWPTCSQRFPSWHNEDPLQLCCCKTEAAALQDPVKPTCVSFCPACILKAQSLLVRSLSHLVVVSRSSKRRGQNPLVPVVEEEKEKLNLYGHKATRCPGGEREGKSGTLQTVWRGRSTRRRLFVKGRCIF